MPIAQHKPRTRRRIVAAVPRFDARTIISDIVEWGGVLRFTPGRSLIVAGLGDLPEPLRRMFLDYPRPAELVAAAREVAGCS